VHFLYNKAFTIITMFAFSIFKRQIYNKYKYMIDLKRFSDQKFQEKHLRILETLRKMFVSSMCRCDHDSFI